MFSQCLHCVRVCVWLKWFVSWFCLFVFQCFRDFLFRDYFCRKLLLWLLFSCSLFSYFFGCLCLFVLFCGFVSFFRRVLTLAERHPHTHNAQKQKPQPRHRRNAHKTYTHTEHRHNPTRWQYDESHPKQERHSVTQHTNTLVNTEEAFSTQWRNDTCQPKHVPQTHQMSKCKKSERHTHTDAQLKGKWMCFMVTIITFFFEKKKKDHNCNWDYLNRHPQELRFKMSDMLGACQIFKCLTLFSMTLRF